MENTAPRNRKKILVTDASSFFAKNLIEYFLSRNHEVFGLGTHHVDQKLLSHKNFTLLDIDLNQPLPSHLPQFDLVCYLMFKNLPEKEFMSYYTLPPALNNIISYVKEAQSRLFVITPVSQPVDLYDSLVKDVGSKDLVNLFLLGDIYGPGMDLKDQNLLVDIILQATTDKIIIPNDGKDYLFPTYIFDAVNHLGKFLIKNGEPVEFLVSQEPRTTLEISYEIQKIAYYNLQKDVSLFFSAPQPSVLPQKPLKVETIPAATSLELGLKNTLNYLHEHQKPSRETETPAQNLPPRIVEVPEEKAQPQTQSVPKPTPPPAIVEKPLVGKPREKHSPIFRSPLKFAAILTIFLVLVFIIKTATDIFFGVSQLKSARSALTASDLTKAADQAQKASNSFNTASSEVEKILFPFAIIFKNQTNAIHLQLTAISQTAESLSALTKAAQSLNKNLSIVTSQSVSTQALDLETPSIYFQKAYSSSTQAEKLLEASSVHFNIFSNQFSQLKEANSKSAQIASLGQALNSLMTDFTGKEGKKTYLLLLQNNTELRPGGGFIGNIGTINFEDGHLEGVSLDDVYNVDGQLKEKIAPPQILKEKLGVDRFYLRDSNWTPDFQVNSQTARDFYRKETGQVVDGVIAFDLSLMQKLLKIIGPIKLTDYNEEITGDNLFERGEFYSEIGFFPGSTQKRDFFTSLSKAFIQKLIDDFSGKTSTSSSIQLIESLQQSIMQKHLMFSFDDADLQSYLEVSDLSRTLPPQGFDPADDTHETRDFLSISEANVGANKVNRFIERKVNYEMTIGRDADLLGTLKITYTNNSQAETWPGGKYANYLRVYLPVGTSLEGFVQDPPASEVEATKSAKTVKKTPKSQTQPDVDVTTQGSLTIFSIYIEVPVKSTKTVTFTYRIHKNIKLETAPTYHLLVSKQPGTNEDPFEFRFNLPSYIAIKSINKKKEFAGKTNIASSTDLSVDRQFVIEVVKK